jgi:N-acetylmuramoyl-L-alanine amidase
VLWTCGLWLCAVQAGAVSLVDIRTDVKEREDYTRCVVQLSGETSVLHRDFLAKKKYLLVDIYGVTPRVAERFITPATGPVRQILVINRHQGETPVLTLAFYLTDERRYRIFKVNDPFRVVVDVFHAPAREEPLQSVVTPVPVSLGDGAAGTRRSDKKIVIIDPGHGGSDSGAVSFVKIGGKKVEEKDVNLAVARELKRLIDASPNMIAYLTRETDTYVSLGDRLRFCEQLFKERKTPGDLFISLHCNATDSYRGRSARGIEFYYLNPKGATKGALRYLEEIENRNGNKTNEKQTNYKHPIFRSLARESLLKWLTEGRIVCENLKAACYQIPYYKKNNNRENVIQSAYFYVLFQREMPAVLVELGFLTNRYDCQRLADSKFQKQATTALYNGIVAYFKARDERFEPKYLALPAGP